MRHVLLVAEASDLEAARDFYNNANGESAITALIRY